MTKFAVAAFCLFFAALEALEAASIGTAPQKCPVQNGNLLDVDLFVESDSECAAKCEKNEKCFYYFFYTAPTKNRQPPQCFLYETCDRLVEAAEPDCYIGNHQHSHNILLLKKIFQGKENVIGVLAFVEKEEECVISCSKNEQCSFYKVNRNTNIQAAQAFTNLTRVLGIKY